MSKIHPVTKMPLEDGHGALPEHVQAAHHCNAIEAEGDKPRADGLRKKLGVPTSDEIAAKHAEQAEKQDKLHAAVDQIGAFHERINNLEEANTEDHERLTEHHETIGTALQRLNALEENAAEHKAMSDRIKALEDVVAKLGKES